MIIKVLALLFIIITSIFILYAYVTIIIDVILTYFINKLKMKQLKMMEHLKVGINITTFLSFPCKTLIDTINSIKSGEIINTHTGVIIDDDSVTVTDIKPSKITHVLLEFDGNIGFIVNVEVSDEEIRLDPKSFGLTISKSDNLPIITSQHDSTYGTYFIANSAIGYVKNCIFKGNYTFLYRRNNGTFSRVRPVKKRVVKLLLGDFSIKTRQTRNSSDFLEILNKKKASLTNKNLASAFDFLNYGNNNAKISELYYNINPWKCTIKSDEIVASSSFSCTLVPKSVKSTRTIKNGELKELVLHMVLALCETFLYRIDNVHAALKQSLDATNKSPSKTNMIRILLSNYFKIVDNMNNRTRGDESYLTMQVFDELSTSGLGFIRDFTHFLDYPEFNEYEQEYDEDGDTVNEDMFFIQDLVDITVPAFTEKELNQLFNIPKRENLKRLVKVDKSYQKEGELYYTSEIYANSSETNGDILPFIYILLNDIMVFENGINSYVLETIANSLIRVFTNIIINVLPRNKIKTCQINCLLDHRLVTHSEIQNNPLTFEIVKWIKNNPAELLSMIDKVLKHMDKKGYPYKGTVLSKSFVNLFMKLKLDEVGRESKSKNIVSALNKDTRRKSRKTSLNIAPLTASTW